MLLCMHAREGEGGKIERERGGEGGKIDRERESMP